MLASLTGDSNIRCGWADDTTVGVTVIPDSTVAEAAKLFLAMRSDLEK
ncbi:hypothetical protein ACH4ZX_40055 [Streptomyces sp. NPDC020490]